jgi:hypothetical protein
MSYEFAGPQWVAFMHGLVVERLERLRREIPNVAWSICEVFTDPPPTLSPDGSSIAWHCVVSEGRLTRFGSGEIDDVEFKVVADYAAILPIARYDTRGEPERVADLGRMSRELVEAGRMRIEGDRSGRNPEIGGFHDMVARVTL